MTEPTTLRVLSSEVVAVSTSNAKSGALGAANTANPALTVCVRIACDAAGWLAFGADPTASAAAGSIYIGAGTPEYFDVPAGQKAGFITSTGTGNLSVAVMGGK